MVLKAGICNSVTSSPLFLIPKFDLHTKLTNVSIDNICLYRISKYVPSLNHQQKLFLPFLYNFSCKSKPINMYPLNSLRQLFGHWRKLATGTTGNKLPSPCWIWLCLTLKGQDPSFLNKLGTCSSIWRQEQTVLYPSWMCCMVPRLTDITKSF